MGKDRFKYAIFTITFLGVTTMSMIYIFNFINKNRDLYTKIIELGKKMDLKSISLMIVMVSIIGTLLLFIAGYVINKIILRIINIKVESTKLAIAVLTAYGIVLLFADLIITYTKINFPWLVSIGNIIETTMLTILLSNDLGKSKYKYIISRVILLVINFLFAYVANVQSF